MWSMDINRGWERYASFSLDLQREMWLKWDNFAKRTCTIPNHGPDHFRCSRCVKHCNARGSRLNEQEHRLIEMYIGELYLCETIRD